MSGQGWGFIIREWLTEAQGAPVLLPAPTLAQWQVDMLEQLASDPQSALWGPLEVEHQAQALREHFADISRPRFGPHLWAVCDACNFEQRRCHFCGACIEHTLDTTPTNRVDRHPCYQDALRGQLE